MDKCMFFILLNAISAYPVKGGLSADSLLQLELKEDARCQISSQPVVILGGGPDLSKPRPQGKSHKLVQIVTSDVTKDKLLNPPTYNDDYKLKVVDTEDHSVVKMGPAASRLITYQDTDSLLLAQHSLLHLQGTIIINESASLGVFDQSKAVMRSGILLLRPRATLQIGTQSSLTILSASGQLDVNSLLSIKDQSSVSVTGYLQEDPHHTSPTLKLDQNAVLTLRRHSSVEINNEGSPELSHPLLYLHQGSQLSLNDRSLIQLGFLTSHGSLILMADSRLSLEAGALVQILQNGFLIIAPGLNLELTHGTVAQIDCACFCLATESVSINGTREPINLATQEVQDSYGIMCTGSADTLRQQAAQFYKEKPDTAEQKSDEIYQSIKETLSDLERTYKISNMRSHDSSGGWASVRLRDMVPCPPPTASPKDSNLSKIGKGCCTLTIPHTFIMLFLLLLAAKSMCL